MHLLHATLRYLHRLTNATIPFRATHPSSRTSSRIIYCTQSVVSSLTLSPSLCSRLSHNSTCSITLPSTRRRRRHQIAEGKCEDHQRHQVYLPGPSRENLMESHFSATGSTQFGSQPTAAGLEYYAIELITLRLEARDDARVELARIRA